MCYQIPTTSIEVSNSHLTLCFTELATRWKLTALDMWKIKTGSSSEWKSLKSEHHQPDTISRTCRGQIYCSLKPAGSWEEEASYDQGGFFGGEYGLVCVSQWGTEEGVQIRGDPPSPRAIQNRISHICHWTIHQFFNAIYNVNTFQCFLGGTTATSASTGAHEGGGAFSVWG